MPNRLIAIMAMVMIQQTSIAQATKLGSAAKLAYAVTINLPAGTSGMVLISLLNDKGIAGTKKIMIQ